MRINPSHSDQGLHLKLLCFTLLGFQRRLKQPVKQGRSE